MLLADIKKFASKRRKSKHPKSTTNNNVYGGVGYGLLGHAGPTPITPTTPEDTGGDSGDGGGDGGGGE